MKKRYVHFLIVLLTLTGSFWPAHAQVAAATPEEDHWYKNSIIYNLDVHTFKDSDGDGYGDFQGLIQKLDYLKGLGVDAIWLAPFQPSPKKDDGYDVADYYSIDSVCGTPGDFAAFMHQAKLRGIRVMMDMVLNHTSDQHPWFKRARQDTTSSWAGGIHGPINAPPITTKAWPFPAGSSRYGAMTALPAAGIIIAFMPLSPTLISLTR